ncbi:MAG: molybdenum cofactor biosynthesis protein MoaE [Armatimonadetes bacterium]|nr:molybdenum cofactor biosynthesis protein MoaE [Armatimonadota bacterium]
MRAYASYREAVGSASLAVDLPDGATPHQVWDHLRALHPRLRDLPPPAGYAINDAYVPADTRLAPGDEVVLIPPVSGGDDVALVEGPIAVDDVLRRVGHPLAGAVVLFLGTVRDNSRGLRVDHLEYEAYQALALTEMNRLVEEARARWPLVKTAIVHRVGRLEVGEVSVAIAVSSPHRGEAFEAGRFLIDSLKQRVPIWKKEVWESGGWWVGAEASPAAAGEGTGGV